MRYLRNPILLLLIVVVGMVAFGAFTSPASAQTCTGGYTNASCDTILVDVTPDYCLTFEAATNGLVDTNGLGTGFKMVDPASSPIIPAGFTGDPLAPSYVKELLVINSGRLTVTATKGINYQKPPASSNNNSLTNGLGVGFNAPGTFQISATIVDLNFNTTFANNSEQGGVWFGIDEDNYTKLVIRKTDANAGVVQILTEFADSGTTVDVSQDSDAAASITNLSGKSVELFLDLDPVAETATASYSVDGGAPISVGTTHNLPTEFFDGITLDTTGPMSFGGIITTKRNAAEGNELLVHYDDFCVTRTGNIEPQVTDDSYNAQQGIQLSVNAANGVLSNDIDYNIGDVMTAALVSGPSHSTEFNLNGDGSFTYTADGAYLGADSFTYEVSDGEGGTSEIATVTLTVGSDNNLPVANDDEYSTDEDVTLTVDAENGILANDEDLDGETLTPALVDDVDNGSLTLNNNGSFEYVPSTGFNGVDTFTYTVSDSEATSDPATVTINVAGFNDIPVAVDDAYEVDEDMTLLVNSFNGVLVNDTDGDPGDTLEAVLVVGANQGSLVLGPFGGFEYTPLPDFIGQDSFTYLVDDGKAESNTATVTITINDIADPPIAVDDTYSVAEGQDLVVSAAVGVLANDSDPDGDAITAAVQTDVTKGTLTLAADGSFTYSPDASFDGTDSFTYTASDGSLSDTGTVTISSGNAPEELLVNGSFEDRSEEVNRFPADWSVKNANNDKIKCNKIDREDKPDKIVAYKGECAFQFKKGIGLSTVLKQKIAPVGLEFGNDLIFSIAVDGKNLVENAGRAKFVVKYVTEDDEVEKDKITMRFPGGTYDGYVVFTDRVTLRGVVDKIVVKVMYARAGTSGKYFADAVSVLYDSDGTVPGLVRGDFDGTGLLPLPEAPESFRGF